MPNKTTPLLFKALLEMSEAHSSKVVRGNAKRANIRHLGSCGVLAVRRASLPLCPATPISTPSRSFINLAAPMSTRRMEYTECRTLGYTPEQMYNVVASVDQYQQFVPWCKKSRVMKGRNGDVRAELEIGFPPIVERYTSEVTAVPNHQVRAVCTDGSLFSHLETIWRFAPGAKDLPDSCKVDFYVSFAFKSLLHSQLASVFFEEVVKQMVSAFESRAATLYSNQQVASLRRRSI
ncbi:coenzyme Q-binding protein COQ10 homolog, mitochondrial-like [Micropterus salmoides]|uniref:coenzyme Q-binding protein COQ10 homolog, mitochondrial n=1 Tax=Micropterus salmoides TaxID=27706 RepID=UPI0018EB9E7F|nr:coenzyme Q-binding protein COQ10 homolog, mitochondrial [Micropterus salmoides]XP_038575362.1 coenzyme Q-binding protein COQ10 homolog, mitochondrial-like [Micropterus salmoides]